MNLFALAAMTLFAYMTCWYVVSMFLKRMDVADIAWGLGFVLIAFLMIWQQSTPTTLQGLVFFLVFVWGIRLATHIGTRARKKGEDRRYNAWRKEWGKWLPLRSFAQVFMLQGILLYTIAVPILLVGTFDTGVSFGVLQGGALALWILGFFFEAVGDYQLRQFVQDPSNKGRIMTKGLWAYTRHPNYFGELCMWWAIGLLVLPIPYGWIGLLGPVTLTILILFVSGIPMAERRYQNNEEFVAYKMRTSVLIPWFRK